jgi:hypothetical protein
VRLASPAEFQEQGTPLQCRGFSWCVATLSSAARGQSNAFSVTSDAGATECTAVRTACVLQDDTASFAACLRSAAAISPTGDRFPRERRRYMGTEAHHRKRLTPASRTCIARRATGHFPAAATSSRGEEFPSFFFFSLFTPLGRSNACVCLFFTPSPSPFLLLAWLQQPCFSPCPSPHPQSARHP